jgi:hypothetical protein
MKLGESNYGFTVNNIIIRVAIFRSEVDQVSGHMFLIFSSLTYLCRRNEKDNRIT